MCGICGRVNHDENQAVDEDLLKRMTATMVYRGPDDQGFFLHGNVGLGHRRLSIIDLDSGRQPIFNEDSSVCVVFNGEIYNYKELRQSLLDKGHAFRTHSDTEVLVHLYEEVGDMFVQQLRGMFSIALWDDRGKKLVLARDRVGKKPLYYTYLDEQCFLFGSEIKAILEDKEVSRQVDLEALDSYLSLLYVPAPLTMFRGIKKLPAGHLLVFQNGKVNIKKYWDLHFQEDGGHSENHYIERLREVLYEAVRIRLRSNVPLGAFLSGGIDSTVVVSIMSDLLDRPVTTSSVGFELEGYNELPYAREVAEQIRSNHREFTVQPNVESLISELVWHFDEPFADSSAIPTYYVSKTTREAVKVALSGDGGDEIFAGYSRYYVDSLEQYLRKGSRFIKPYLLGRLAGAMPEWVKGRNMIGHLALDPAEAYARKHSHDLFSREAKKLLYSGPVREELADFDVYQIFRDYYEDNDATNPLDRALYVDLKTYLVDDILVKVDRMSMANSLEVRAPLLDHHVIEFMATLPPSFKIRFGTRKYILKKTMSHKFSRSLLARKKHGFTVPLAEWLSHELRGMVESHIFDPNARCRSYFDVGYLWKIWSDHLNGVRDHSHMIWMVLMLELWHRRFINGEQ